MKKLDRVKQILDESVNGGQIGVHGAFWRPLDLEHFKSHKVFGLRIVVPGDVDASNLVRALRGLEPFGSDIGTPNATFPRMPVGFPAVSDERIEFIENWIRDNCPDEEWVGPAK
jgi:hypothetical protein